MHIFPCIFDGYSSKMIIFAPNIIIKPNNETENRLFYSL